MAIDTPLSRWFKSYSVKCRILGLELMSPKNRRKFRCSLVVFVCWAFIAAVGLAFYLIQIYLNKTTVRLNIGLHAEWYLRRQEWQAMDAYNIDPLAVPVSYVIIGHSAGHACHRKFQCIEHVLNIQKEHLSRQWDDIGPNFLVGGDGYVFEGRGANVFPAMAKYWNRRSITVMFLGDFTVDHPNQLQFEHLNILLEQLVKEGMLSPDYVVYGHCQVAGGTVTPGPNIIDNLINVSHWNPANSTSCLRH